MTYGGDPIPKSPFNVGVSPGLDLGKIKISGLDDSKGGSGGVPRILGGLEGLGGFGGFGGMGGGVGMGSVLSILGSLPQLSLDFGVHAPI